MSEVKVKKAKKKFVVPSPFLIIFAIMILFILISWITKLAGVSTSVWNNDKKFFETKKLVGLGILDAFTAVWHGFIDKAPIILFIFCIGGTLGLITRTKAMDAGIESVVKKLKGKEIIMIPILMMIFGLGGTSFGMWEETVGFFPILIPVFIKAGYGPFSAVAVILLGAGAGNLGSTVNPFATGAAFKSAAASIESLGSSTTIKAIADATTQSVMFGSRWLIWFIFMAVSITFVTFFCWKVKNGKIVIKGVNSSLIEKDFVPTGKIKFTWRRKITIIAFCLGFVFMIISYLPWNDWLGEEYLKKSSSSYNKFCFWLASISSGTWECWGKWGLISVAGLFLFLSFIIFALNHNDFVEKNTTKHHVFIDTFIDGSKDVLSVCLLIAVAAGLGGILKTSLIGPWIANSVSGLGSVGLTGFGVIIFLLSLALAFLIPSTSGFATAFVPIFVQIAYTAFIGKGTSADTGFAEHLINYKAAVGLIMFAFLFAEGIVNLCSPTSAALMAYTNLSHVPYNVWMKHTWKLTGIFTMMALLFMVIFGCIVQFHGGVLF